MGIFLDNSVPEIPEKMNSGIESYTGFPGLTLAEE